MKKSNVSLISGEESARSSMTKDDAFENTTLRGGSEPEDELFYEVIELLKRIIDLIIKH